MSDRLLSAFAALGERGHVAGADAVWQRAVLAAAVDDRPALTGDEETTPLVPVVRADFRARPGWIEVGADDDAVWRNGRRRVGLAVGLTAAAVLGIGAAAVVLRDGDERRSIPGGQIAPTTGIATETTTVAFTQVPGTVIGGPDQQTDTTFGGGGREPDPASDTTYGGGPVGPSLPYTEDTAPETTAGGMLPSGGAFGIGTPCTVDGGPVCVYSGGTMPPAADGPGGDWMPTPATLPGDAELVYWRMLDDLDITWRAEADGTHVYWRTPAGQNGTVDGFGGPAVLLIPATDRYIVLARTGTTETGAPGQRPLQVRATLEDGTMAVAPLVYDLDIGIGHAYLDTNLGVVDIAAV